MELSSITERIAVVNGESKRLNNQRQVLIGKKQTLENQLSSLLAAYKKDYGVELTVETLESEIQRVSAMKEAEVSSIEAMLGLIKAGQYEDAEKMAKSMEPGEAQVEAPTGVVPESVPQDVTSVTQMQPTQSVQEQAESAPVSAEPAKAPVGPPTPQPAPPVTPPTFTRPPEPATPPVEDDIPAPPPPVPKKAVPTAPSVPSTPKIGVPPAVSAPAPGTLSFQAILSGQAFHPQEVQP